MGLSDCGAPFPPDERVDPYDDLPLATDVSEAVAVARQTANMAGIVHRFVT